MSVIPEGVRFNQRINIFRVDEASRGSYNEPVEDPVEIGSGWWAGKRSTTSTNIWKSAERHVAGSVVTSRPLDFYVRWDSDLQDLDIKHYIVYKSEKLNILYVDNINDKDMCFHIIAEQGTGAEE